MAGVISPEEQASLDRIAAMHERTFAGRSVAPTVPLGQQGPPVPLGAGKVKGEPVFMVGIQTPIFVRPMLRTFKDSDLRGLYDEVVKELNRRGAKL